jgi:hypothetical protein
MLSDESFSDIDIGGNDDSESEEQKPWEETVSWIRGSLDIFKKKKTNLKMNRFVFYPVIPLKNIYKFPKKELVVLTIARDVLLQLKCNSLDGNPAEGKVLLKDKHVADLTDITFMTGKDVFADTTDTKPLRVGVKQAFELYEKGLNPFHPGIYIGDEDGFFATSINSEASTSTATMTFKGINAEDSATITATNTEGAIEYTVRYKDMDQDNFQITYPVQTQKRMTAFLGSGRKVNLTRVSRRNRLVGGKSAPWLAMLGVRDKQQDVMEKFNPVEHQVIVVNKNKKLLLPCSAKAIDGNIRFDINLVFTVATDGSVEVNDSVSIDIVGNEVTFFQQPQNWFEIPTFIIHEDIFLQFDFNEFTGVRIGDEIFLLCEVKGSTATLRTEENQVLVLDLHNKRSSRQHTLNGEFLDDEIYLVYPILLNNKDYKHAHILNNEFMTFWNKYSGLYLNAAKEAAWNIPLSNAARVPKAVALLKALLNWNSSDMHQRKAIMNQKKELKVQVQARNVKVIDLVSQYGSRPTYIDQFRDFIVKFTSDHDCKLYLLKHYDQASKFALRGAAEYDAFFEPVRAVDGNRLQLPDSYRRAKTFFGFVVLVSPLWFDNTLINDDTEAGYNPTKDSKPDILLVGGFQLFVQKRMLYLMNVKIATYGVRFSRSQKRALRQQVLLFVQKEWLRMTAEEKWPFIREYLASDTYTKLESFKKWIDPKVSFKMKPDYFRMTIDNSMEPYTFLNVENGKKTSQILYGDFPKLRVGMENFVHDPEMRFVHTFKNVMLDVFINQQYKLQGLLPRIEDDVDSPTCTSLLNEIVETWISKDQTA